MHIAHLEMGHFTDTDEWCAAATSWDLDFRQLDCGRLDAVLNRAFSPRCVVQRVSLGRRFHQAGASPGGYLSFGVPDDASRLQWYGRESQPYAFLNFNRALALDAVSEVGFVASTYSVSDAAFDSEAESLGLTITADQVRNGAQSYVLDPIAWQSIARTREAIFCHLQSGVDAAKASVELEHDLVHMLVRAIGGPVSTRIRLGYSRRQKAVNRALDFIAAASITHSIGDVVRESRVSWRTLDRGFKERFGVSPKKYIVARRLIRARQDLLDAAPPDTVCQIAYRWGFWHLSRFSNSYCRMFGELPAETLARSGGRRTA